MNSKEGRYLRDTLEILHVCKKRRSGKTGEEGVGHETIQEQRKSCLKDALPILKTGRLSSHNVFAQTALDPNRRKVSRDDFEKEQKDLSVPLTVKGDKFKALKVTCHKSQLQELKKEKKVLEKKRKDTFHDHATLISSYEYGLNLISNLKDLTQTPDNVMHGNFTRSPV